MDGLRNHLAQDALEMGNSFKRRELELEKKQQHVELELLQIKADREAASIAFQRGLKFGKALGREPMACPSCWVCYGRVASAHTVASDTAEDIFRCSCGYETVIPG